jgi:periplasmic protein TonB
MRMLKNAPKWKPGVQNGKTIRVKYSLPIMLDIKME